MKTILRLLAVLFLLLATTFCEEAEHQTVPAGGPENVKIYDVEHNGHSYIIFRTISTYGVSMEVIHDPDCYCWFIDPDSL